MIYDIETINRMDGHKFESLCSEILELNGFSYVEVTKGSGDYGVDITAYKDGNKYAFQCKRHSNKVGVKAVQEVSAGAQYYNCTIPVVITNSTFTPQARNMAEKTHVELWDKNRLLSLINAARPVDEERHRQEREELERAYLLQKEKKRKSNNTLTAVLLIIIFPFGLIPLLVSKWALKRKLTIIGILAVFIISTQLLPNIAAAFYIAYCVAVIISVKKENEPAAIH